MPQVRSFSDRILCDPTIRYPNSSHLNRIPKIEYSCDGEVYQPVLPGELKEIQKKCDYQHDGHEKGQHVGECELTPKEFFDPAKCPGRYLRFSFNIK